MIDGTSSLIGFMILQDRALYTGRMVYLVLYETFERIMRRRGSATRRCVNALTSGEELSGVGTKISEIFPF